MSARLQALISQGYVLGEELQHSSEGTASKCWIGERDRAHPDSVRILAEGESWEEALLRLDEI